MLTVYGRLMPLRILEEIRFWKLQEKERAIIIRELVPNLEAPYQKLMAEWENVFDKTEQAAQNLIDHILANQKQANTEHTAQIQKLAERSVDQTKQWIEHLNRLIDASETIRTNATARTVEHHIVNESKYFLGILDALLDSNSFSFRQSSYDDDEDDDQSIGDPDLRRDTASSQAVPIGGHKLPPLPYAYDALEPYIDEQTMRLHHDKHHKSYVDGLNKAEKMLKTARETNDFELIKHWEREAAFHGAGHYLHTIFWNIMRPDGGGKADGAIAAQINRDFGSFERFKQHFSHAADKVEGGGWAILVWSPRSHRLEILQAEKHQNLSQWDVIPLLVLDVWEHAYYLKYQNERKKYIDAWWNTVNWDHVNERFAQARRLKWMPY